MAELIKVLIVDDIPETREMLKKLLAFEPDIEVIGAASTGREGLDMAAESRPHIVLMDINMPDMDGITATEEIRKLGFPSGVIMMSVQSESDYLRRAMMAGARDFLTKPISGEDLYQTIRRVYDQLAADIARAEDLASQVSAAGGQKRKQTKDGASVIAVYSPQGGAGVTTIATNVAVSLMREGTRVLLMDMDLQFGDVGVFLNLNSRYTIVDLVESAADMDREFVDNMTVSHGSGLKVLLSATSPDEADRILPEDLPLIVKEVSKHYDYVIIDMAKRLDDVTLNILDLAERIVLVATPTLPSVKNTRIMLDLFGALDYPPDKVLFVMNRVGGIGGRASIPVEAIEQNLKRQADGQIPLDDRAFLAAVNQGVSVIAQDPHNSPAADLIQLAEAIRRSVQADEEDLFDEEADASDQGGRRGSRLSGIFGRG